MLIVKIASNKSTRSLTARRLLVAGNYIDNINKKQILIERNRLLFLSSGYLGSE